MEARCHGTGGVVNIDTEWHHRTRRTLEGNDARGFVELNLGQAVLLRQMAYGFDVEHDGNVNEFE